MICPKCKTKERQVQVIKGIKYSLKGCRRCLKIEYEKPYLNHRKNYCEECGFIPFNMCQLDVDHIDGDHANNNIENLKTLCANCHRLKTWEQRWG